MQGKDVALDVGLEDTTFLHLERSVCISSSSLTAAIQDILCVDFLHVDCSKVVLNVAQPQGFVLKPIAVAIRPAMV